jgi:phosphatidylglycerophosphate synthase
MMADSKDYQPERRPIASREKTSSKRVASWMVKRGFSPNAISVAGMIAGVAAGIALALTADSPYAWAFFISAAVLMQLRLLANMLDGMVAVESGLASPVGELFNEIPDRVSDTAMFIGAGYALGGHPELGYIAACLALFVAYLRAQGSVAGAHQEFCGPMAKPERVFTLTLLALLCGILPSAWQQQIVNISVGDLSGGLISWGLLLVILGMALAAIRRLQRISRALRKETT